MIEKISAVKYYAIIVGGGSGTRMGSEIPKQFLPLNGLPVLMHTIKAFHSSPISPEIIVVLNFNTHDYWKEICKENNFTIPHTLVAGGEQRFHSVRNGLEYIKGPGIVAIHDAVRPCVSVKLIDSAYRQAEEQGNAVAAVISRDSVRKLTDKGSVFVDRQNIFLIQTPQVFNSEVLKKAYLQEYDVEFTDDASVVEKTGVNILLIEGETSNLKITFPEDILVAESYLNSKK